MSLLSRRINLRQPKENINLIKKSNYFKGGLPVLLMGVSVLVIAAAFLFLGFVPRYRTNLSLEEELNQKTEEIKVNLGKNSEYEAVKQEYIKYGTGYLSEAEAAYVSRRTIIEKAEKYLLAEGSVLKLRISGNTLVTTVYEASMSNASDIIKAMLNDSDGAIEYASTTSANNDMELTDSETGEILRIPTVSMKIIFAGIGEEENAESN